MSFGQKPAFGSNVFGSNNNSGGLFGNKTNTGGGLFGSSNTSTFGSSSGAFGGGSSNVFGTPAAKQQSGGLFGSSNTGGFGSTNTGAFGSTPRSTSAFGTQQKSGGLFGSSNTSNAFGTSSGGLFGSGTTGGFGSSSMPNGTGGTKFQPVASSETVTRNNSQTTVQTSHNVITAMKEYQSKSFEELHWDDKQANRNGGTSTSAFGSNTGATSGFSFGNNQNTGTSGGLFGNNTATKSAFGTTTSQSGGLFGSSNTNTGGGLFGNTAKPAFGSTAASSNTGFSFGSNNQQQSTSLFGSSAAKPASTSLFGNTGQSSSGGLFGNTNTATNNTGGGLFGSSNTGGGGGLFGNKTSGFGTSSSTASTGLFGASKPAANTGGSLFGGFGNTNNTNTGSSLFGNTATNKPAFGATNTGGSLFGNTNQNKTGTGLFSGFGNTNTATSKSGGLGTSAFSFNTGNTANNAAGGGLFGATNNNANTNLNLPSQNQQQSNDLLQALIMSPFGDSPLFRNKINDEDRIKQLTKPTNPLAQKAAIQSPIYRVKTTPLRSVRPKIEQKTNSSPVNGGTRHSLFAGLNDDDTLSSVNRSTFVPRKNIKKLNLKVRPTGESILNSSSTILQMNSPSVKSSTVINSSAQSLNNEKTASEISEASKQQDASEMDDTLAQLNVKQRTVEKQQKVAQDPVEETITIEKIPKLNLDKVQATGDANNETVEKPPVELPSGIKLTPGGGYYTKPALENLADLTNSDGKCIVDGFTIGRKDYGSVSFKGKVDITGINFDEVVAIRRKEVTIYPDDNDKPPLGQGLNRKAEVTLLKVWPTDKTTREPVTDVERLNVMQWQQKIESVTTKMGAKFLEYRADTGKWVFQVQHFSKYGLDSSDEEEDEQTEKKEQIKKKAGGGDVKESNQKKETATEEKGEKKKKKSTLWSTEGGPPAEKNAEVQNQAVDSCGDMDVTTVPPAASFISQVSTSNLSSILTSPRMQSLGINQHKLQDAQKSLFADFDDEEMNFTDSIKIDNTKIERKSLFSNLKLSQSFNDMDASGIGDKVSNTTITNIVLETTLHSQPPKKIRKEVVKKQSKRKLPTLCKPVRTIKIPSTDDSNDSCVTDVSDMLGRSFRVGWGPNWTLASTATSSQQKPLTNNTSLFNFSLHEKYEMEQQRSGDFNVQISKISAAPHLNTADDNDEALQASNNCLPYLHCALRFSQLKHDEGGHLPSVVPLEGNKLTMEYAQLAREAWQQVDEKHSDSGMTHLRNAVFTLLESLWGDVMLNDGSILSPDQPNKCSANELHQTRKGELISWLINSIEADQVAGLNLSSENDDECSLILKYLLEGNVQTAVKTAISSGNNRLALLLSQVGGSPFFKMAIDKQLVEWESLAVDQHIDESILKIYCLLAGKPLWLTSNGDCVNTCDMIDWKRCLLAHLIYISPSPAPLHNSLEMYQQAYQGTSDHGIYCAVPLPFYQEKLKDSFACLSEKEDLAFEDVCYQIITLYCDRTHPMEKLLSTSSSVPHHLDHRMSWHVWRALTAITNTQNKGDHLHVAYANQLESCQLWHQAVFVLMHITNQGEREKRVLEVISRNVQNATQEEKDFLTGELQVPVEWLHQGNALLNKLLGNHMKAAEQLIDTKLYRMAHDILMKHVAPESLINGNFDQVKCLLETISNSDDLSTIPDWNSSGQIYLSYFNLQDKVSSFKKGDLELNDETTIASFISEVRLLCSRVNQIECENSVDKLAKSEIAKQAYDIHTILSNMQMGEGDQDEKDLYTNAKYFRNLHMSEDLTLTGVYKLADDHIVSFD